MSTPPQAKDRRQKPERRAFFTVRWFRERRSGWDRRAKVAPAYT